MTKERTTASAKPKLPFSQRHPALNAIISLTIVLGLCLIALLIIKHILTSVGNGVYSSIIWIKNTLSKLDAVVVVALITGTVSIISVLFTSVVSKIIEHITKRNEYLYQKREEPYKQFLDMYYNILQNKKLKTEYKSEDMILDVNKFSKDLTLWGSNGVVKLWVRFRTQSINGVNLDTMFLFEKILYAMRKDMGFKKMKKGTLLKFFINDLDEYAAKQKNGDKK